MPPSLLEFDSVQINTATLMSSTVKATAQLSKTPVRQPDLNFNAEDFLQLAWSGLVLFISMTLFAEIA